MNLKQLSPATSKLAVPQPFASLAASSLREQSFKRDHLGQNGAQRGDSENKDVFSSTKDHSRKSSADGFENSTTFYALSNAAQNDRNTLQLQIACDENDKETQKSGEQSAVISLEYPTDDESEFKP